MGIVVLYLRLIAFSVAALSLSACARMSLADPTLFRTEPMEGHAPTNGMKLSEPVKKPVTVADVEEQLAELDAKIVDLKRALQIMRPGVHDQEFAVTGAPESAQAALYQQAPDMPAARSLFRWADTCASFSGTGSACRTVEAIRASN